MKKYIWVLVLLGSANSWALDNITPTDLSGLSTSMVDTLIQVAALGTSYRPYQAGSGMGLLGFDLGVDLTAVTLPAAFESAIQQASGQTAPSVLPVPMVKLQKGLPFGINVGAGYMGYQGIVTMIGADAQYSIIGAKSGTAIAARVSANYSKLYFLETHTYNADVIVSRPLLFLFEPYVGAGMQFWNGNINYPPQISQLPVSVPSTASGQNPHFFVGIPLKILLFKVTAEYDHSFAGIDSYGVHVSLSF